MSSATGIRLLYCEMERPGNLPSYPPKQHYGLRRHKGKHSGLDVARLNKVRVPCRATRAGSNIKTWTGLSAEESIRMTEDRDKWRKYVHGVANPRIEDG